MQTSTDRMRVVSLVSVVCALLVAPGAALAGKADVIAADATCGPAPAGRPASVCSFSVTVRHADGGWEHFANRWDVVDSDGKVVASRVLRHPHVDEQPFERSLGNVRVPHTTKFVRVRANDSVHGAGGAEVEVVVPHEIAAGAAEAAKPRATE
jgi:hypothetical protein